MARPAKLAAANNLLFRLTFRSQSRTGCDLDQSEKFEMPVTRRQLLKAKDNNEDAIVAEFEEFFERAEKVNPAISRKFANRVYFSQRKGIIRRKIFSRKLITMKSLQSMEETPNLPSQMRLF